jgi:NAD(P)-dependent dehydrogenase (short-subunit alcohol dehydrogenase family)
VISSGWSEKANIVVFVQGASRGIGLEFCRQILERHPQALVYGGCRRPQDAKKLQELQQEVGKRLEIITCDLNAEHTLAAMAKEICQKQTHLDLLINASGILHDKQSGLKPEKRIEDLSGSHLMQSFQINAIGAMLVVKYLWPLLRRQPCVIANISAKVGSISDNHLGGWYGYRASKAALNMFTKTLAIELGRRNSEASVVALHPGTTDTELSKPFQVNVPDDRLFAVERTVAQLLEILYKLTPADSGRFFSWDGSELPW